MRRLALLAVGASVAVAGCGGGGDERAASTQATRTVTVTQAPASTTPAAPAGSSSTGVADVVARVVPSVVHLRSRNYDGSTESGSGVVLERGGVIVTNEHVVHGARTVTVTFFDGRHDKAVRGSVVGASSSRDIAIVQVPVRDLTPAKLGASKTLRLGDGVMALGFPLDLKGGATVTRGIVSALGRSVHPEDGPRLSDLVQTDAAINPGNSGGALVDESGRLVGIVVATADGRSAENIGFAIGIDQARPVIKRLRGGSQGGAWLGATFESVSTGSAATQLGLPADVRGAVASSVYAGGPAAKAGMRAGDVVVTVDGRDVGSAQAVTKATSGLKTGAKVVMDVVDQSGPRRITVTVGRRPASLTSP